MHLFKDWPLVVSLCSSAQTHSCQHFLFLFLNFQTKPTDSDIVSFASLSHKRLLDNELYTLSSASHIMPLPPSLTPPVTPNQHFSHC